MTEEIDTFCTYEPICPYCGEADESAWETFISWNWGDPTETDNECGGCGKTYKIKLEVDISYTTEKMEDAQ